MFARRYGRVARSVWACFGCCSISTRLVLYTEFWYFLCLSFAGLFWFGLVWFVFVWFGWLVGCVMVSSTCVRSTFFCCGKLAGVCASDQTWRFSPIVSACPWEGVYFPFENSCITVVVMGHGLRQIRLRCRHQAPRSSCESCYIYSSVPGLWVPAIWFGVVSRLSRSPCGGLEGSIPFIVL